jgi:hypothetical protein
VFNRNGFSPHFFDGAVRKMIFLALLTRLALRFSTLVGSHRAILQFVFGSVALVLGFWGWSIKSPVHDLAEVDPIVRTTGAWI